MLSTFQNIDHKFTSRYFNLSHGNYTIRSFYPKHSLCLNIQGISYLSM
uniref:Uncharacterized protein n=1 Tax=Arundo donax TaxID=35708 RepID=A0A0A9BTZ8_ARUDO